MPRYVFFFYNSDTGSIIIYHVYPSSLNTTDISRNFRSRQVAKNKSKKGREERNERLDSRPDAQIRAVPLCCNTLRDTSVNPTPTDVGRRYIRNIGTVTRATAIILLHLTSERVGINMQPGDDLHLRFSPSGKNAGRQCRRDIAGIRPYEKRLSLTQPPTEPTDDYL